MKRFFFTNSYFSGIRVGIQAGHSCDKMWAEAVSEYFNDPESETAKEELLAMVGFVEDYGTWIVLSAGDDEDLRELVRFLNSGNNPYPFSEFEEPGVNDAMTSICMILPERMYDAVAEKVGDALHEAEEKGTAWENEIDQKTLPDAENRGYSEWELDFLFRKAQFHLAA